MSQAAHSCGMTESLTVELDDDARLALTVLTRDGSSVSAAVRRALVRAAAVAVQEQRRAGVRCGRAAPARTPARALGAPSTAAAGRAWGHVARAAEPVDQLVTDLVLRRLAGPDAAALLTGEGAGLADLREQAGGLRSRLEGLAELYADGVLTDEQLAAATQRIRRA